MAAWIPAFAGMTNHRHYIEDHIVDITEMIKRQGEGISASKFAMTA
ncbi:MAG: hypothetical protein JW947_04700 [Sedimentisphaerales bacterium]|nr:hypothetical protein [Sedimentisphaerales bacterium]